MGVRVLGSAQHIPRSGCRSTGFVRLTSKSPLLGANDRQQFIAKFKENAVSAPIAIVTGAVTTTILIWLQHAFHFIK